MNVYSRFFKPAIKPVLGAIAGGAIAGLVAGLLCSRYPDFAARKHREFWGFVVKCYDEVFYRDFREKVKTYFANEGRQLREYLQRQGREFYELAGIEFRKTEGTTIIAAIELEQNKAVFVRGIEFESKLERIAKNYDVAQNVALRYILDHETVHLSQKGKSFEDNLADESDVEKTLLEFYNKLGAEHKPLAQIASSRLANISAIYALRSKN